jgi:thioesterase domain-containing protein
VKIRGFRIEPGEIEAELARHPQVREAVVLAREDGSGDKRLVAYVVTAEALPVRSLQTYLKERLPEYMVPVAFVSLAALPKTPNGKVDRRALPAPDPVTVAAEGTFVAPRDHMEMQLAMLWESILGVQSVGVDDNFFELGGHSLLAVRMFAQVAKIFGKSLPLATLFQAPTLGQLAELLRRDEEYTWDTLIPIQPRGSRPPFFCVAAPNVNALGFVFLARHVGPDQPLYGLQSQYGGKRRHLYTVEEYRALAANYIAAMRKVQPQGPYYLGGTCEGSHIAFEIARLLIDAGEQVGLLIMFDAWPLENTTSYFIHSYIHHYHVRLKTLLAAGLRETLREIGRKAKDVVRQMFGTVRLADPRPPAPPPPPEEDWKGRLWPGPDFTPPAIATPIVVFWVSRQPYWRVRDKFHGWGPWTRGGVEMLHVPGRHFTFLREPHVQTVARMLNECLRRSREHGLNGTAPAGGAGVYGLEGRNGTMVSEGNKREEPASGSGK